MNVFINYATDEFKTQQDYALKMAIKKGGFDKSIGFTPADISHDFLAENKAILMSKIGAGYWLWKPYFIVKALHEIEEGDYLLYADAGSFLIKDIDCILDKLKKHEQDVMAFELPLIESQWTKAELFSSMECNESRYLNSNQVNGSFHLIRKSNISVKFYREFLSLACDVKNITNEIDGSFIHNVDYIEHRYDQSIFSLLYKKYNFSAFKDPSQFGDYPERYAGTLKNKGNLDQEFISNAGVKYRYNSYVEKYGMVIFHNRARSPRMSFVKFKIKDMLLKSKLYKNSL